MMQSSIPYRGNPLRIWLLIQLLMHLQHNALGAASERGTDAIVEEASCNQADCIRCELDSGICTKCLYVMMAETRECRTNCPEGYATSWSDSKEIMGRICTDRQMLSLVDGKDIFLIAGAAIGGAICVGMVIGALLYMKQRTKPTLDDNNMPAPRKRIPRMGRDKRPNTAEITLDGPDREEFLSKLTPLRGEINNFVDILTETRKRFRGLGKPDSATDTKAKAYRAVVRDLSRVVSLMNRKDEHIKTVPQDWRRLLTWATRVLDRYKRQKQAKEFDGFNTIEPLSSCSMYQTRRQAQKERCRLVIQSKPVEPELSCDSDTDKAPSWKSSSRSSSMVSLAPIIFEEDEDNQQEKADKMKELDDNEFMNNMEFMENTKNEEEDFCLNELDKHLDKQNRKSKKVAPPQPPARFKVVDEGINSKILKEKNNNVIAEEKNLNSITRLNNMINESYLSSINISNSLANYKTKELEFFNSLQTPVFKPVEESKEIEAKLNSLNKAKSQLAPVKIISTEKNTNPKLRPNSEKIITNKANKENRRPKPPVPPKPKTLMKINQQKLPKYQDSYTNVTRKPVSSDLYRDDTIEQVHATAKSKEVSSRKEKMTNKKELMLSVPRIELTTNL